MSDFVEYVGKVIEVKPQDKETLEDLCKRLLNHVDLGKGYSSYTEMLSEELSKEYFVINDKVYKLLDKTYLDPSANMFLSFNVEGEKAIPYRVRYYDGGCSFEEALEEAINNCEVLG